MNFIDSISSFFSKATQTLNEFAKNNVPIIYNNTVPPPAYQDAYTLNRYSNDLREQSPEYQAELLAKIKEDNTRNIIIAAVAGLVVAKFVFK